MSTENLRVGVIGLGLISRAHLLGYEAVADRATIAAVCDADRERAEAEAARRHCRAYADYRELLADPAIESVDIILPHNLHHEVAKAALERGKHVLVEKPMAPTASQCRELIDLARRVGRTFTVAENTRFVEAYLAASRLLATGALGAPRLIRTLIYGSEVGRLRDTRLWKGRRAGTLGGSIFDAGPHSFYLIKWLFGEIRALHAMGSRLVPESEVEDHAVVTGTLRNGALFTAEFTFTAEIPWGERCEVYGSEGSLIIDQLCDPPAVHYRGGQDYAGHPLAGVRYDPRGWKTASIGAGVVDFVEAIRAGRAPAVDPEDGLYAVQVVERAYESLAHDGRGVEV